MSLVLKGMVMNGKSTEKQKELGHLEEEIDMNMENPQVDKVKKESSKKRLSVERIYQKKTQLEHIILRPDSYIGSVEPCSQNMWIWDGEKSAIISKSITYTPGLYKIFDEIIVNAADNKQRDPRMNTIKVTIDQDNNTISVWNNGKGIPIEMHKVEKMYVPSMIFGHLLTSSNYNDDEKKVVGGRNGFGAKLCNIFSTKFTVETATEGKRFKQTWRNNMGKAEKEKINEKHTGTDFTCITFCPDLPKFKMERLDDDFVALLKRRAYDMAGVCRGVSVYLNGERLKVKTFKEYVGFYLKGKEETSLEGPPKIVHEIVNPRWELCVTTSENGFQQASFVNSIATTKGGSHVNYIVDQICEKLIEAVKKKTGKGGYKIKPFQVKSHIWVFANTLIENPTFDSQTKENMTLRKGAFGSTCELTPQFIKNVQNCGVLDNIMSFVKFKSEAQLSKKSSSSKHSRLKGIPKLDDANDAGTKYSRDCTLIVTEGDSAKALAMAGLSIVGRDKYGVFPLKGKLLNVRDATHKQVDRSSCSHCSIYQLLKKDLAQDPSKIPMMESIFGKIMENAEIGNLLKIIGLQIGKKYESENDLKSLRYGHLMIMADQDQDGSHIKGLVINFIHSYWPSLLKLPFLEEFITPIVKVTKGNESRSFFSIPEFEEWKSETANHKSWKVKYYKGLGTSTSKEGKEYFSNMQRHRIVFNYDGPSSDQALIMAFSKKCINDRKNWLNAGMEERRLRKEAGLPEIYLYGSQTRSVTYGDFINKELILFSNMDNERSIPCLIDGLKPGQRKVLFTCLKRNDKKEVKVAQLAGSVAELSAYHHGEMSLMGTIINLAQNYVGSNNLNLLQPFGQFGTRHMGGKDSASPRYIFTMLSSLTRLIFPLVDDNVLAFLNEDNQWIEPEWYCPIIPMVLVNGAEGIGTGYSTKIPNYDIREVVENTKRMISEEELEEMLPSYKNFTGDIERVDNQKFVCRGTFNIIDDCSIEITELPVRLWTQSYKETLDLFLYGNEKVKPCISDYKEYHTDTSVRFVITFTPEQFVQAEREGFYKKFKLETFLHTSCMVLFDQHGCLKRYETIKDIFQEFYKNRLQKYKDRKAFLLGMLDAECSKLENQARFILEKIDGTIVIENKTKRDVITRLLDRGFESDPVKKWKTKISKEHLIENDDESEAPTTEIASSTFTASGDSDFQYLLSMAIMSLSKEKKDALLKQRDEKKEELETLRNKTISQLWLDDLDKFTEELDIVEEQERLDEKEANKYASKSSRGRAKPVKPKAAVTKSKPKEIKKKETAMKEVKDEFAFSDDSSSKNGESQEVKENIIDDKENINEVVSLADRLKKKKPVFQRSSDLKPKSSKSVPKRPQTSSGEESDYSPKPKSSKSVTKRPQTSSGEESDFSPKPKSSKSVTKRPQTSSGEESDYSPPRKKKQKKTATDSKPAKSKPKPVKKPANKKARNVSSDDDESFVADEDYVPPPEPRARTGGRAAAAKKKVYTFSSDESEDDDDGDGSTTS